MTAVDPVLQAIVEGVVEATGAVDGWIAAHDEGADELVVVAAVGPGATRLRGRTVAESSGTAGYVLASGQPLAIGAEDARFTQGLTAELGVAPAALLCVPCEDADDVLGVLELTDRDDGTRFSADDLTLASLFARVAAVALRFGAGGPALVPTPAELGAGLTRLADADPIRYAHVAELVRALVGRD